LTFWTPSGLAQIAQTESSGNPTAVNPSSGASGLYGFLTSTWQSIAPQAGVDINQYPTAASAPASVQTAVASITPISNWTCAGCNSAAAGIANDPLNVSQIPGTSDNELTQGANIADPDSLTITAPSDFAPAGTPDYFSTDNLPGTTSGNLINPGSSAFPSTSGALTSGGADYSGGGDTGYSAQPTSSIPTAITSAGNAVANQVGATTSGFIASIQNWLGNGLVMILAIVIAAIGLWMLAGRPGETQAREAIAG
jgi:hypothetical protein